MKGTNRPFIAPITATVAKDKNIKSGKYSVLMGQFNGEEFSILEKQGPGMVSPLKEADGLVIVSPEVEILKKGQIVRMIPLFCNLTAKKAVELFTTH